MAYVISDECISCGACADGCPVNAISEGDGKYVIDEGTCIGCGACASICDEVFEIKDDGYAEANDKEVTDEEVKENAISAMEGCPTSAIREVKDEEA